jgi:hypothetical protein
MDGACNKETFHFGIYDELIQIPYLTGIYNYMGFTENENQYIFTCKRKYLLSFAGGSWRGPKNESGIPIRDIALTKFNEFKQVKNIQDDNCESYDKLFYCPILAKTHSEEERLGWSNGIFSIKAKEVYLDSVFSWQPSGDTSTRRGFYEAILLGNIPLISKSSFSIYKNLLIGEETIKNIVVVLDDDKFFDSDYVIIHLLSIKNDEIVKRRNNIYKIRDRLQWGVNKKENAFNDILQKVCKFTI